MEEEQPQGEEEDRRVQLQEGSGRMRTENCPQAWAPGRPGVGSGSSAVSMCLQGP